MEKWEIGVFASAAKEHGELGASLEAVRRLGVTTVQLGAPRTRAGRANAARIKMALDAAKISVNVVFCGFNGSSYETLAIVKETVGLAPFATRAERLQETFEMADFACQVGAPAIGMHLGVIPGDASDPQYGAIVEMTRRVCDYCRDKGLGFHLETGQETADELLEFIAKVARPNLAVNFDPANMILYGKGDPLAALRRLGSLVRSVHCKDATYRRLPGQKWYEDCPLGTGDVNIREFIRTLDQIGYAGPLTIEREYSPNQESDLIAAILLLEQEKKWLKGEG